MLFADAVIVDEVTAEEAVIDSVVSWRVAIVYVKADVFRISSVNGNKCGADIVLVVFRKNIVRSCYDIRTVDISEPDQVIFKAVFHIITE